MTWVFYIHCISIKKTFAMGTPVSHTCNPNYSGGRDQKHHGPKPAQRVCETLSPPNRADGVAEVVEHLPSKYEVLCSNPSTTKKKKCC
jgi:hypothetical protein